MNPMRTDTQLIATIESLPWEYFCPVCQYLIDPNKALQSMCGHLYCKSCLTYVARTTRACPYDGYLVTETDAKPLVESNKMLADTIDNTLVYCSYQYSGCMWVGSLADSLFHCSDCDFANAHVMCCWCGIHMAHHQWGEHVQFCHDAYNQASVAMATTHAGIAMATTQASATLTQGQWYQQPYQQYYQNYVGDYMQQKPMQRQSFAPQNQVIYVQAGPAVHHVAQNHSHMQPQPHVQSHSLTMHPPHDAFPSPQVNTVQDSLAQSTINQCQSNQPHASWTELNPQPNQTNQEEAPPKSMFTYHQDHFREQVTHVRPPQFLSTVQKQQSLLPIKLTRDQYLRQHVLKFGGESFPESSDMHSLQQLLSQPSLPQQQTAASATDVVHNQMQQEGFSIELEHGLEEHPQEFQEHQHIPTILGVKLNMNHFSATAPQVGIGHAAPSLQRIPKQVHWPPLGQDKVLHIYGNKDDEAVMEGLASDYSDNDVNRAAEVTTIKFDHKLKIKLTDACAESVQRYSNVMNASERKSGPLSKQLMEENIGNGWEDLGKSLLVEKKSIKDDPSLDGTPIMNPTQLEQDGLPQLRNLGKHFLMLSEKSSARSAESLDRGFDKKSSVRTQEKDETGFELRPSLRPSQPSMDLGEGQFIRGPRIPISEHLGMTSHGYGPSGGRPALHKSESKGIGNLQMGKKVIAADMIGPVDNNGVRLGDVGSQSRYGGDGVSFPGEWVTEPDESLGFHSQTKAHDEKT